jgi:hypothetical protein
VNLKDAIYEHVSGLIIFYSCRDDNTVDLHDTCEEHDDTRTDNLEINMLANVAQWYFTKAKALIWKNTTLPFKYNFFNLPTFPCTQALRLHPG